MDGANDAAKVAVVIPAHNEEELLESCLVSIRTAAEYSMLPVEVIVVADDCVDGTAAIAAPFGQVLEIADRNVGAARRAGFRAVARPCRTWMATTDADSTVPVDWLARQLTHASAGVELLAGTVQVANWDIYPPQMRRDYERRYRAAPPSTRIHGCNLGFSGARYASVGGFAALSLGEDIDLVHRFVAAGACTVWTDESPVMTSSRRISRATGGFAAHLASLEASL